MVVYTLEQRWEVGLRWTYRRFRFWQKNTIFSDGAHFDLGGYVNKKNCRIWGTENPNAYSDRLTEDFDFGKKKLSFQMKYTLILADM